MRARKKPSASDLKVLRGAARVHSEKLDFPAAFTLIDTAAVEYEIDPIFEKSTALKSARRSVKSRLDAALLASGYLNLTEAALLKDDYKAALQGSKDALRIAKQAADASLAEEAVSLGKKVQALRPVFDRFKKAQATLARTPDDPKANTEAGRYLCFVKNRWKERLPHLVKGSDKGLRNAATQELGNPTGPVALADGWYVAAQKERIRVMKTSCLARAVEYYETALLSVSGTDKLRITARIDQCFAQGDLATQIAFVQDKSMDPYSSGYQAGTFPPQKGDDATGPFRGEGMYFNQRSGTDVVYEIRSGKRLRHVYWKGAAMSRMTIEILDMGGNVVATGGPWGGGNAWGEFTLDFSPMSRFMLRLKNHVSSWYYVDTLTLK